MISPSAKPLILCLWSQLQEVIAESLTPQGKSCIGPMNESIVMDAFIAPREGACPWNINSK